MTSRVRRLVTGALGITVACASLALAGPGDDATIQAVDFHLTFNSHSDATASCPLGSKAVGGGFGPLAPPTNIGLGPSGPVNRTGIPAATHTGDRPAGWYAEAYSGEGGDRTMRVFAVCSPTAKARLQVANFKVPTGKTRTKIVECPSGQSALGGGLGLPTVPTAGTYQEGSGPLARNGGVAAVKTGDVPRRWRVSAYNGTGATRKFQALAICSRRPKPRLVVEKVDVPGGESVEIQPGCPAGTRALGGGVLLLGNPGPNLQVEANGPIDSSATTAGTETGDTPVGWDGIVYNRLVVTRFYKALAVCA